ncbi:alpha/beta hydrolase family protein [Roseateles sp.]|uniref:alpha/beta hydrolase family protein n=1 Tax=Roseateles sp. TaxID=1971397 RepID=UPI0039E9F7AD
MRPTFLSLLLAAMLASPLASAEAAPQPALPPLTASEAFSAPDFISPRLSPDGLHLAMLTRIDGRMHLAVLDLSKGSFESRVGYADADVSQPTWLGTDHLVYTLAQHGQSRKTLARQGGMFVTTRDGARQRKVYSTLNDQWASNARRYTRMWPVQTLPGNSTELIVGCDDVDKYSIDLYRIDVTTGKRQWLTRGRPERVRDWVLDAKQEPRIAIGGVPESTEQIVHYRDPDGSWRELWRYRVGRDDIRRPVSVEADGKLLVATNAGRDTMALREYDPASGQWGDLLVEHPQYDVAVDALGDEVGELLRDELSGELLGVRIDAARPQFAWMDTRRQSVQRMVDLALPGRVNLLQFSASPRVLVSSRSDTERPRWYLLDRSSGTLTPVLDVQGRLDPRRVPTTESVTPRSRDGQALPGYVLRPPQATAGAPLPTVVLVHGGPWTRGAVWGDSGGDMSEARWLASRGYLVLLPSFRGSAGFGKRFMMSSRGQYGMAMQDDIDDAVDALVQRGDADPQRLCIMGASYGGYAALIGAARAPERYRCAIAGFPISDLARLLSSDWSDLSRNKDARPFLVDMIGDPVKQRAALDAVSPLFLASRIKAKVMIYAGVDDPRTPLEQAELMRTALERAGNPPVWMAKYGEGHGYSVAANQWELLDLLEPFLAEQLAPAQPRR